METTRDDIDFWVLPVTPYPKQLNDTMSTIDALISMGVEPGKVIVIPNMVSDVASFEQEFQKVSSCAEADGFLFCPQAVLENGPTASLKIAIEPSLTFLRRTRRIYATSTAATK